MNNAKFRGSIKKIDIKNSKKSKQSIIITLDNIQIKNSDFTKLINFKNNDLDLRFYLIKDSKIKTTYRKFKIAISRFIKKKKRRFIKCLQNLLQRLKK